MDRQAGVATGEISRRVTLACAEAGSDTESESDSDVDDALCELYSTHYKSLVRLAASRLPNLAMAEDVVQDAFVAMHAAWGRLRDTDSAHSYLRQSVVNRSKSMLRHLAVVDKYAPKAAPYVQSAELGAITLLERSAVVDALQTLPARQREALVLRYYTDLSVAQVAREMGVSPGTVKSHTSRGLSALRNVLEEAS
jgi:RNA polymerase sigma-70 factor (sigma-E family)